MGSGWHPDEWLLWQERRGFAALAHRRLGYAILGSSNSFDFQDSAL
jgi:hypothetical protein